MPGALFLFPLAVIDPPGDQKQDFYFSWPNQCGEIQLKYSEHDNVVVKPS